MLSPAKFWIQLDSQEMEARNVLQGHPIQMKIGKGLMVEAADHQKLAFDRIENHLPLVGPSKYHIKIAFPEHCLFHPSQLSTKSEYH